MKIQTLYKSIPLFACGLTVILLTGCNPGNTESEVQTGIAPVETTAATQASFADFSADVLERFWSLYPDYAVRNGRYEFAGRLTIPNASRMQVEHDFWDGVQSALQTYPLQDLAPGEASDWYILQQEAQSSLWYLDSYQSGTWDASQYNVGGVVGFLLNTEYAPQEVRLEAVRQILEQVPAYYAQAQQNLGLMTLPHTELAIQQNQGTQKLLAATLPEIVRQSALSGADQQLLLALADQGSAAVSGYVNWLQERLPALQDGLARDFRLGSQLYSDKFHHDLTSTLTAGDAYTMALAEKERLHKEMLVLTTRLWPDYFPASPQPDDPLLAIGQMIDRLAADHATAAGFVDEVRQQIPALEAFVVSHNLMTTDPEKPLVVRETPEYQRGFSVASIEAPGPYDSMANTYYNVEPIVDYPQAQAESFLREYNRRMMQILNIHEAIPGHYTQLVHANKSPSLIKSVFGNGTMVEGWAVYAERMMLEAGYGDFEPELWLMWYKWNLRTVVNTILDYRIQVENLQEDAALDLLMREAFQEQAEATGKWRRATLSQVQLASYFTGYADIYALQQEERVRLAERFDLKAFHDHFLSFGSAPVPVIRQLMQQ